MSGVDRALFSAFPRLAERVRLAPLGEFPTRVERVVGLPELADARTPLFAKRDDLSSTVYGGNKVRTLEVLFGDALARGVTQLDATGAYGTNHGLATLLHAPRAGLSTAAVLFPQPYSTCARDNLRAMIATRAELVSMPHWSFLPFAMWQKSRRDRARGVRAEIMVPGGATATGGLGYVNAAFELAAQVARGELPEPSELVIGVGSTCTTAGLLVGLHLAQRLGLGLRAVPRVFAVRVTPWPVTSAFRIVSLAMEIAAGLVERTGDRSLTIERRALAEALTVDGSHLGPGYGYATDEARALVGSFERHLGWTLDTTYSAKSAAAAIERARHARGPVLFWSTKSTAALPQPTAEAFAAAPASLRAWLARCEVVLSQRERRGLVPA